MFGIAGILAAFVASPWTDLAENSALLATNGFGSLPRVRDVYAVAAVREIAYLSLINMMIFPGPRSYPIGL